MTQLSLDSAFRRDSALSTGLMAPSVFLAVLLARLASPLQEKMEKWQRFCRDTKSLREERGGGRGAAPGQSLR